MLALIEQSERFCESSEYGHVIEKASEALILAEAMEDPRAQAHALYILGIAHYDQLNYQKASEAWAGSRQICEKQGFQDLLALNICHIGAAEGDQGRVDEAIQMCSNALDLSKEINYAKGQILAHYHLGIIHRSQGRFDEAIDHFNASFQMSEQIGYVWGISASRGGIGRTHLIKGDYPIAMENFKVAFEGWQLLGNKRNLAYIYHQIGVVHFYTTKFSDALENYLNALRLRQEIGDHARVGDSYHDIGHIYLNQDNAAEALVNYQNALEIFKKFGIKERIAKAYNSIGLAYTNLGDMQRALENFEVSIKMQRERGDKPGLVYSLNNIGRMYIVQGEYMKALQNLHEAEILAIELGHKDGMSQCFSHLSNLYTQMDSLAKAREYVLRSIDLAREMGSESGLMWGYYFLSRIDSAQGNYLDAFEHIKLYKEHADAVISDEQEEIIAELKVHYETEKKDHEIERLENAREIDRLEFALQQELLGRANTEKEKIRSENLYHLQRIEFLHNEKALQQLQMEKHESDLIAQKAIADKQRDQLQIINKEKELQAIRIKRQTLLNAYLIVGVALFALLSFFAYNYFMTRQKLKLHRLRNRIASDLHDDIGGTLSSIAIFSEIAQQDSEEVKPALHAIGEHARRMLDSMADIVWTINPENDQFDRIITRMRSFAYELLGARKIDFEFDAEEDIANLRVPMEVRRNLYLIFKEATNNMVKYAEADRVYFSIKSENETLSMKIRDNGRGFDLTRTREGNGLRNMRRRAEEIGGSLNIDTAPGMGTTVYFNVSV